MNKWNGLLFSLVFLLSLAPASAQSEQGRILFGSCMESRQDVPILKTINQQQADVFLFLGDNIYADTENMQEMAASYQMLASQPEFSRLRQRFPVMAIWDDHDYGKNDAGQEYPAKEASRRLFLKFWQEPENSPRWQQEGGIYTAKTLQMGGLKVQVIMPDLRWNRTPLKHVSRAIYEQEKKPLHMGPYERNTAADASLLGEAQWRWLEQVLQQPADVRILASSIQVLSDFTGWESWANFPADQQRLFDLLNKHKVNGLVMISGDTHWSEIMRMEQGGPYPLYEMTSSGLNKVWPQVSPNRHRLGKPYVGPNYGEVALEQEDGKTWIKLAIHDMNGDTVLEQRIPLSALQANTSVQP